ncbi:hypothetical protein SKAU_G00347950 [Synaphobranchus kaupii]|uniref:Uncharacterized protein n=1 Tax=Synaphobranchus kaupii TaxID=118154 RepID=A0A9Q1EJX4_SYNKA|nr:hypothetical protein SKAU_G00347950 [Synaphobranchus kaupii]
MGGSGETTRLHLHSGCTVHYSLLRVLLNTELTVPARLGEIVFISTTIAEEKFLAFICPCKALCSVGIIAL